MALNFGDYFSNALHDIKRLTGKKIGILQDEIGYGFEPPLSGTAVEKWRYRSTQLSGVQLERLAELLLDYGHPEHDRGWLTDFLTSGGIAYPEPICSRFFPLDPVDVPRHKKPLAITPPNLTAYRPPATPGFVGRSPELEYFDHLLMTQRVAILTGMAGVGKTTLAARLASQHADQFKGVFWHRFHDANVSVFIRRLAGFLAHFERSELWDQFEATRMVDVDPPDETTCFDILTANLERLPVLICLDDLQFVEESRALNAFLSRLFDLTQHTAGPALLITSRRFPRAFKAIHTRDEISGLSLTDCHTLLTGRGLVLSAEAVDKLHQVTRGNGAFLTLAGVVLRHAPNPDRIIDRLATTPDIERFLLEEVDDRLTNREQAVMTAVAILDGYPAGQGTLEAMIGPQDLRRSVRSLVDQYLLVERIESDDRTYTQHPLVQAFYSDQPARSLRKEMHRRAAVYFEHETGDFFQAVFNYARAGASPQAFKATSEHFEKMVNQGFARPLRSTLSLLETDHFSQADQLQLGLIQGRLDALLGDYDLSRTRYEQLAALLQTLPQDGRTDLLKGQVCLAMAELLERQAPPEGLAWAQRGLEIIETLDDILKWKLQIQAGTIMMHMGNFGGALEQIEGSLEMIPEQNYALQISARKNLGAIYWHLDQKMLATEHTQRALSLSKRHKDHLQTARIAINLGPILYTQGDWAGAIEALEEALAIARRLGSHAIVLSLHVNLGRCYVESGDEPQARHHLERALDLSEASGAHQAIAALINLARLHLFNGRFEKALVDLEKAEAGAVAKNDQLSLAAVHTLQAEALAKSGDLAGAEKLVEQARREARLLSDASDEGICWRISGYISAAQDEFIQVETAFSRSVEILDPVDRYQAALSRLAWGEMLFDHGDENQAVHLVRLAHQVFSALGARREVARTTAILRRVLGDEYNE